MADALFAGSFDPPTFGHLDIIETASRMFEDVIVVVATNPDKKYMFTADTRKLMIENMTEHLGNIVVISTACLVADIARDHNVEFLVRGLRATSDYEYELNMSYQNRHLNDKLVTIGIFPKQEHIHISSSTVRHLRTFRDDRWKQYVPQKVVDFINDMTKP
jgi:pantetheine-phosphate adenylyltransferase